MRFLSAEKMHWVITHREEAEAMGEKARKVYEEFFSLKSFDTRLKTLLEEVTHG